jgi:hypothetical protein
MTHTKQCRTLHKGTLCKECFKRAEAHHELKIDVLRYAWLRGFTLEQRIRLGLQEEYLQKTFPAYRRNATKLAGGA